MIGEGGGGPEISRRVFLKKTAAVIGAGVLAGANVSEVSAESVESFFLNEKGYHHQNFIPGELPRNAADRAYKESLMDDEKKTEQQATEEQGNWALSRPDIVIGLQYVTESGEAKMNVYFGQAFSESGHADDTEYFPNGGILLLTDEPEKGFMKQTKEAHKQGNEIKFYQHSKRPDGSYGVVELTEQQIPSAMQRHYLELGQ